MNIKIVSFVCTLGIVLAFFSGCDKDEKKQLKYPRYKKAGVEKIVRYDARPHH